MSPIQRPNVRLWVRLLKNSHEDIGREIKESKGGFIRIFFAEIGWFLDHCRVTDPRKLFFNSLAISGRS